jgi:type I restriction enzyme S subunit
MATASSTGSKMPRADWKVMKQYKVALPPSNSNLLEEYQATFESICKTLTKNVFESREILEMRDWLLPLLMNGQVTTSQ